MGLAALVEPPPVMLTTFCGSPTKSHILNRRPAACPASVDVIRCFTGSGKPTAFYFNWSNTVS